MTYGTEARLRVDTHVHFHECFSEKAFFQHALANVLCRSTNEDRIFGALCLTETSSARWFERLGESLPGTSVGDSSVRIRTTREPNSLIAVSEDGEQLAIFAGRQIVCNEGLEVLALGHRGEFPDGEPIRQVLTSVAAKGAIPVIPWGFGKWLGRRGVLVRRLIAEPPCAFALGDNGGRWAGGAEPGLFSEGRAMGIKILPGSDPFPFKWDQRRVGSFGMEFDGHLSPETPYADLRRIVESQVDQPVPYGRLTGTSAFVINQAAIQIKSVLTR